MSLKTPMPSDIADYLTDEELMLPVEDKLRIYYLKKAVNGKIKKFELSHALEDIKNIYHKYIDSSDSNISTVSHWVLGTYFHEQFETYPIVNLLAQKQSGKTRALKLSSTLCKNGDGSLSASLTETHLFRRVNKPAFFDELESINNREQGNLRELLNASYKRGSTITRYREKKKEYVEEVFSPFYPIMIANISGLNDVLGDRSIEIILRRSNKEQTLLIEDYQTNPEIQVLKKKLSTLKAEIPQNIFSQWNDYVQKKDIKNKYLIVLFNKILESKIQGRALEIFFPLFIVSYLAEDLDNFLQIAKEYVTSKKENELVDNFDERLKLYITAQSVDLVEFVELNVIVEGFRNCIETPETWINSKWVAKALKRLDLIAQKRLYHGKTQVRLKFDVTSTKSTNPIISTISTISTNNKESIVKNNVSVVPTLEPFEPEEVKI